MKWCSDDSGGGTWAAREPVTFTCQPNAAGPTPYSARTSPCRSTTRLRIGVGQNGSPYRSRPTAATSRLDTNWRMNQTPGSPATRTYVRKLTCGWAVKPRSEERRVGKECRARGAPYHEL